MRLLNKRENLILRALLSVVGAGAVFYVFIAPIVDRNEALNIGINKQRKDHIKYSGYLSRQGKIQAKYAKFSASDENENGPFAGITELQRLADNAGVHILEIKPEANLDISVRLEGQMSEYFKFLHSIENSASLLTIKRAMLFSKPNSESIEGSFTIRSQHEPGQQVTG